MKDTLARIIAGERLSSGQTRQIMTGIARQQYSDVQVASLLMGLQMRGITEDELLGLREGLLETGHGVDFADMAPIDIVGTGGDGKNTFNISTCACFVVAGAGYKVAKHGNCAATSVSGASDVIAAHGARFSGDEDKLRRCLATTGFVYLHAPLFATGMRYAAPARKAMGVPTCFNLLGPLVNPCRPPYQLLGVATLEQMRLYSRVYEKMGIRYGIVTSVDGYDEVSLTGKFKVKLNGFERVSTPEEAGFGRVSAADLFGGNTREQACEIFDSVLQGKAGAARTSVVVANAALAINVVEQQLSYADCVDKARESLASGRAWDVLQRFVEFSRHEF